MSQNTPPKPTEEAPEQGVPPDSIFARKLTEDRWEAWTYTAVGLLGCVIPLWIIALLKLGYCQYELKAFKNARATLEKVVSGYPGTEAARLAAEVGATLRLCLIVQGGAAAAGTDVKAMVDADMEEASARLQALQVQQQLSTQALSIANQQPQSLLSLFR